MNWIVTWISMTAAAALPTVPADGIRDDARIFGDASRQQLIQEMKTFHEDTGVRLFIDTNTYLEATDSTSERARGLLQSWGADGAAVVVCIDRASQALPSIVVSDAIWERSTTLEIMTAIRAAAEKMGSRPITESEAMEGVTVLMQELKHIAMLARTRDQVFRRQDIIIAAAFGALLLLGSGIIAVVVKKLRSREATLAEQHLFPDIEVGQRFGAPNGGGVIVEINYRK